MMHHRSFLRFSLIALTVFFSLTLLSHNKSFSQDGGALFNQYCASCHGVLKNATGPALGGLETRGPWADRKELYKWIHNPAGYLTNDPYTQGLRAQYGGVIMTAFPNLTEPQIDGIVDYINTETARAQAQPAAQTTAAATQGDDSDSMLLYGLLTLILAVIALILLQVNSNLRKLADDKEGNPTLEPVPFYRNKTYLATLLILLFLVGGYLTIQGGVGLGRSKGYEPDQPIYYSHKVHAGVNQISCLYCHNGAQEDKHANIPSVNVCMNCHMAISEYGGNPALTREDGTAIDGTAEIQKLYEYAGWDPKSRRYTGSGKPIKWVRVHNLPDHVYFNHAQHVTVGQQNCQTCHGNIQQHDLAFQYTELSMGWCINCHRESKVQFANNKFYSIYEKFHEEIKNKKLDSVTVEKIGGTECMKCHY